MRRRLARHLVAAPELTLASASRPPDPLSDLVEIVVIERSMVSGYNETKPIFTNDTVQVWSVAAVSASNIPALTDGPEVISKVAEEPSISVATENAAADVTPTDAAAEAAPIDVVAESSASAIGEDGAVPMALDELELSSSSAESDRKRKRSPSPPRIFAAMADLPVVRPQGPPTPTDAAQPYFRLHPAHSANGTRALLEGMFRSSSVTALRPPELPLLGVGAASQAYNANAVMPALARVENDVRLSYVMLGPEKRGRVDVKKSDALGVPRARISELTSGNKIFVTDPMTGAEVEVRPEQILGAGTKASAIVIVNCPSEAYIDSLVETALWRRWFGSDDDEVRPVHVMWHKTCVWADARYQAWMAKFGKDVVVSCIAQSRSLQPAAVVLTACTSPSSHAAPVGRPKARQQPPQPALVGHLDGLAVAHRPFDLQADAVRHTAATQAGRRDKGLADPAAPKDRHLAGSAKAAGHSADGLLSRLPQCAPRGHRAPCQPVGTGAFRSL